jgi:hypothetical protein
MLLLVTCSPSCAADSAFFERWMVLKSVMAQVAAKRAVAARRAANR